MGLAQGHPAGASKGGVVNRTPTCVRCGTTEGVAIYNLCGPCLKADADTERAAQGLPATISDPAVIEQLGRILAGPTRRERAARTRGVA